MYYALRLNYHSPYPTGGTCSNGVKGIESKGACCVLECGLCGGIGCSTVGASLGLGAGDCCEGVILENNEPCGEAPCVVTASGESSPAVPFSLPLRRRYCRAPGSFSPPR